MNEWYDIPSEEMTLEQARSAVRELRKKVAEQFANMQNDWISVKDRLPDDKELYLICTESNFRKIDIAYFQAIGDKFSNYEPFWQGRNSRSIRVTYWMPLPELPESEDVPWVDDDTLPNEDMIPDNEFMGEF